MGYPRPCELKRKLKWIREPNIGNRMAKGAFGYFLVLLFQEV